MLFLAPTAVAPNMAPLGNLEMVAWLMFGDVYGVCVYTSSPFCMRAQLYLSGKSWVSWLWIIRLTLSGLCHVTRPVEPQESYGVCRTSVSSAGGFTFLTAAEGQIEAPRVWFSFFFLLEVICIDVIPGHLDSITALLAYSNTVFINCELVVLHVFETTMSEYIMPVWLYRTAVGFGFCEWLRSNIEYATFVNREIHRF